MANVNNFEPVNSAASASVNREARNHATGLGRMDAEPTADETTRGALHFVPGADGVADILVAPLKDAADTTAKQYPVLSTVSNSALGALSTAWVTLGPFLLNDVPGTATTEMKLAFFNTATALSFGGANENDFTMPTAGAVVGAFLMADDQRTAGSATLQVRVNQTATAFLTAAVALDATNTTRDSAFDATGLAFAAGDEIGVALVTDTWTPTTANATAFLICRLDG